MGRKLAICALALATAVALVAASSGDRWSPDAAAAAKRAGASGTETKLTLKDSPYGRVLFSGGYAMYVFTRDDEKSRCYGDCAEAWPPLKARGALAAGKGVREELIGTVKRRSGRRQVTYDGRPLYGYVHDPRGRVLCHEVVEFGGTWLAVRKSGEPAP